MPRSTAAPRIPDDLRDDFRAVLEPSRAAVVRADFLPAFRRLGLLAAADEGWEPGGGRGADAEGGSAGGADAERAPVGGTAELGPGRGPLHRLTVPELPSGGTGPGEPANREIVVRPYRRGGLVRHLVEARYLLGDRAFHELTLLARLRRRGLPVPAPLAAVQRRRTVGYRAALVTRLVPGVEPLSRLLEDVPTERARRLMAGAGATVGRLHAAGGRHSDLNAHNLLADPGDPDRPVYLVDLDRGRLTDRPVGDRAARRGLRRLRRSLEKLGLEAGLSYWDALEREYRRNRGGTAGDSAG